MRVMCGVFLGRLVMEGTPRGELYNREDLFFSVKFYFGHACSKIHII